MSSDPLLEGLIKALPNLPAYMVLIWLVVYIFKTAAPKLIADFREDSREQRAFYAQQRKEDIDHQEQLWRILTDRLDLTDKAVESIALVLQDHIRTTAPAVTAIPLISQRVEEILREVKKA